MPRHKIWEVDIDIVGPISVKTDIKFRQEKGFDSEQFYSDISIKNKSFGISVTLTAYAENIDIAKVVAFVYLGRMIDILILDNEIELVLYDSSANVMKQKSLIARRQIEKQEFEIAFKVARKLEQENKALLKAIGWYSKAKVSNNALDSFLSYWNVIEIIGTQYHTPTERTANGVINKIYQCFLEYIGEESTWELPNRWINNMHDKRSSIAHGGEEATSEAIYDVAKLIPILSQTARKIINKVLERQYPTNIWYEAEQEIMDFF